MLKKHVSMTTSLAANEQPAEHIYIPVLSKALGSWRLSIDREPLSDNEITKRYDRKASHWMQTLSLMGYLKAYRSLFQTLFTDGYLSELHDAPWILDAGTGSGALSLAFNAAHSAQTPKGNAMFSGIDQSPEMLRIAQCSFDEAGLNAALHNYDICQLPWEQDTFDFAMAAHVIEHIPSPEKALHELVRVLQPGAPLLLVLTKKSFLGALVQMNWRVHSIGHTELSALLKRVGLIDIQFMPLDGLLCNQMSIACVARKASPNNSSPVELQEANL